MDIIGIAFSTAAALLWASAVILFKKSGESLSPIALNLFKCTVTILLLVPTLLLFDIDLFPERPVKDWIIFGMSGFLGVTLADTFFFMALSRIGAGLMAIIDCLYLPMVLLLSFVFLDEILGSAGILGVVLVTVAIFIGAFTRVKTDVTLRDMAFGITMGILAILLIAISIVLVKELLAETHVLWATFVRMAAGTLGLYLILLIRPDRKIILAELYPPRAWRSALPGSIAGNYLAVMAWLAGMKFTLVSVAAVFNQLSTVFIFLLAAVYLKEPVNAARLAATLLAVSGAILVGVSI